MLYVRSSIPEDAVLLAANLRKEDEKEVRALSRTPLQALQDGLKYSEDCLTIALDDKPVAMFGVVPMGHPTLKVGLIWLLASPDLLNHKIQFLRHCRAYVELFQSKYDLLTNAVHSENTVHIQWLRWCGFTMFQPQNNFISFVRIKKNV